MARTPLDDTDEEDTDGGDTPAIGSPLHRFATRLRRASSSIQAVRQETAAISARQTMDTGALQQSIGRVEERLDDRCGRLDDKVDEVGGKLDSLAVEVAALGKTTTRLDVNLGTIVAASSNAADAERERARAVADHRSKRTIAIIAVVGPIIAAAIAALAMLAARG